MRVGTRLRWLCAGIIWAALLAACAPNGPNASSVPGARILTVPVPPAVLAGRTNSERSRQPLRGPHLLKYFSIPSTTPFFITRGAGRDFWFTTGDTPGSIGTIGLRKHYVLYPLPPSGPNVSLRIAAGPNGNLWATLNGGIAKITPSGHVTVYRIATPGADLGYITAGPDGNLWFTEHDANQFARITPSGKITEFPFDDIGVPNGIVSGPDGRLWMCEQGALDARTGHQTYGRIVRVDTTGKIRAIYPIVPNSWQNVPEDITVGADHKLWFTQFVAISQTIYEISNVTLNGKMIEYKTPTVNAGPGSPVLGGDANVWFSEAYASQLARVTPSGHISEFPLPQGSAPYGLASNTGKGRQIWFADFQNGGVGVFSI